jgi:predicted signal transduction protein with EAL and GGDEF domain
VSAWQDIGLDRSVSINLPPAYCQPTGMNHLLATARAAGVSLDRLVIEVTESALTRESWQAVVPRLAELHEQGLKLAIDDFGTGYSSLGRLDKSWVSMLKIDRAFVKNLSDDEHARSLVSAVVHLVHSLGLEPVAEESKQSATSLSPRTRLPCRPGLVLQPPGHRRTDRPTLRPERRPGPQERVAPRLTTAQLSSADHETERGDRHTI